MQDYLRRRVIGAVILVSIGVIFIPMVLDRTPQTAILAGSPVPAKPGKQFEPLDIPLELPPPAPKPTADLIDRAREEAAAQAQVAEAPPAVPPQPAKPATQQGTIARTPIAPQTPTRPPPKPAEPVKPAADTARPVPEPQSIPPAPARRGESWIVQVGSFSSADNAQKLKDKLRGIGFPAFIERVTAQEGTAYKVRIGPMAEKSDAETTRAKLHERLSLSGIVVRYQ